MVSETSTKAFGKAIFCDDIRTEVGGKFTLVGVYPHVMFVNTDFPVTIPKFGIAISLSEPLASISKSVLLQVFMPGDHSDKPTSSVKMAPDEVIRRLDRAQFESPNLPPTQFANIDFNVVYAPLSLKCEGTIEVQAKRDEGVVRLGALRVIKNRSAAQPALSP